MFIFSTVSRLLTSGSFAVLQGASFTSTKRKWTNFGPIPPTFTMNSNIFFVNRDGVCVFIAIKVQLRRTFLWCPNMPQQISTRLLQLSAKKLGYRTRSTWLLRQLNIKSTLVNSTGVQFGWRSGETDDTIPHWAVTRSWLHVVYYFLFCYACRMDCIGYMWTICDLWVKIITSYVFQEPLDM